MTYAIIQTILVYGLLTFIMYLLLKESYRRNKNEYLIFSLLIYATIFGLRYCVGVDWMSYAMMYEKVASGYEVEKEYGFIALMKLFSSLGLGVSVFFAFCAFIQLSFIFILFKDRKEILPYLVLTFMMSGEMVNYANVIRNMIAFAIVAYSLKFVQNRRPLMYYFCLFVAFFFHKSCAVMVIIYPLYLIKHTFFQRRIIPYTLLLGALILMNINYVQEFISQMDNIMALMGYGEEYAMDERMDQEVSYGLGFIIEMMIICIIIYYSPKVKEYYSILPVNVMFDLFVIGIVLKYSFIGSLFIQRMNAYFVGYTFILSAIVLSYMKKCRVIRGRYILLGLYCMLGLAILYRMKENSGMFIFNFQDDLFYLKNEFRYKEL